MANGFMTNPRPWPNNAKEVRDLAAEISMNGRREIEPLLTQQFSKEETIRRLAVAIVSFHKISRLLESVGAQSDPLNDFSQFDSF